MNRDLTHRVVAKAFLPNPQNLPEVNHKNGRRKSFNFAGTKANNYQDGNLEWVDRKQNMIHASRTGLININSEKRKAALKINQKISVEKAQKPIAMTDESGIILAHFKSIKVAGDITGITSQNIARSCRGECNSAGGYMWKFIDKEKYEAITQEIV